MSSHMDPKMLARLADVLDEFQALKDIGQEWLIGQICVWKSSCLAHRPRNVPTYRRGFTFDLPEDASFVTVPFTLAAGAPAVAILLRCHDEEYLAGWVPAVRAADAEQVARSLNEEITAAWAFHRRHPHDTKRTLHRVGCFRELGYGEDAPSLEVVRGRRSSENKDRVVRYLRAGKLFVGSPGLARDVFDRNSVAGSRSMLTDGEYAWPDALAYYVERYAVALPADFEDHLARRDWQPPGNVDVTGLVLAPPDDGVG